MAKNDWWGKNVPPVHVKTDDTMKVVSPKNGRDFSLEELHDFVGGYIEIVRAPGTDYVIVLNEQGKILDPPLPINRVATLLYDHPDDCIVGDVLICHKDLVK